MTFFVAVEANDWFLGLLTVFVLVALLAAVEADGRTAGAGPWAPPGGVPTLAAAVACLIALRLGAVTRAVAHLVAVVAAE